MISHLVVAQNIYISKQPNDTDNPSISELKRDRLIIKNTICSLYMLLAAITIDFEGTLRYYGLTALKECTYDRIIIFIFYICHISNVYLLLKLRTFL